MSDHSFAHLHVHTEFSLLDGLSRIPRLVERAQTLNMPAIGITDHGTMFGVIDFYRACRKAGIKPIIGVEAYVARRTMQDRDSKLDSKPFHLLLLAKNQAGYRNLLKIASKAQLEGYYYRPRIDRDFLAQHADGLIATSGCLAAQIPGLIMEGRDDDARDLIDWYLQVFGRDNFFLELQSHEIDVLKPVNNWLIDTGRRDDVRLLATNDVHYVHETDYDPHDTLLCIQSSALKTDTNRLKMTDNSYYLRSIEEMWQLFGHINDGEPLLNSLAIAEMCDLDLERKGYHLPIFPVPEGYDAASYLRVLCERGLRWRYGDQPEDRLRERLDYELGVIHNMGFDTYFLIVWDLCEYARQRDIWWNVRGSGAGSIAAYCLGITNIDPIQNNLLFERFLNPGRVSMPDIDIDYPEDRRAEMIAYTARRYGEDKVAAIITFGTLGAKAAVRDVGRALGLPLEIVNQAARLIPTEPKPKPLMEYVESNPDLKKLYESDAEIHRVIDTARELQGVSRHASTHAAGIIVADKPLDEYIPLHRQTKEGEDSAIRQVTQFPMETCESIGLLKIDFLGLSTLTILRKACDLIERHHGIRYTMDNIPYRPGDNPEHNRMLEETFELIGRGETVGIFQVESSGMQQMLRGMRPTKFEHIVAGIALYRPGPMDYIPTYNNRMHGKEEVKYHHEKLRPILEETFGILVFQEQIMQAASDLFSYSLGEADLMRRAVSKKKKEDLLKHRSIFLEHGPQNGVDEETAGKIFDDIEFFANYGFNKCLVADTQIIDAETGYLYTIGELAAGKASLRRTVTCSIDSLRLGDGNVTAAMSNGVKPVYALTTRSGRKIKATANHPFYTFDGWRNLGELAAGDLIATPRRIPVEGKREWAVDEIVALADKLLDVSDEVIPPDVFGLTNDCLAVLLAHLWKNAGRLDDDCARYLFESETRTRQIQHLLLRFGVVAELRCGDGGCCELKVAASALERVTANAMAFGGVVAHSYAQPDSGFEGFVEVQPNAESDLYWDQIVSIEYAGEEETFDLTVERTHNFVANDILAHNSHAADYGVITVQTAFLKAHYPHEYMTALLSVYYDDATKVTTFLAECKRMDIPILPPDVNYSLLDFDVQAQADGRRGIRFGLAAIKNAGIGALQYILDARDAGGRFKDLEDFCTRVDLRLVGKRALESLVKVGAMSSFGARQQLMSALDRMLSHSANYHKAKEVGQMSMFGGAAGFVADDLLQNLPGVEEATQREMLDWEKELLGLYVSSHPIDPAMEALRHTQLNYTYELKEADAERQNQPVKLVALVASLRRIPTRNMDMMAVAQLEDRYGTIEAVLFPRTWRQHEDIVTEGAVVLLSGRLDVSRGDPQIICERVTQSFDTVIADGRAAEAEDGLPAWIEETTPPVANGHTTKEAALAAPAAPAPVTPPPTPEPPVWDDMPPWLEEGEPLSDPLPMPEDDAPPQVERWIRIRFYRSDDPERDKRRLRKLYNTLTSYPGKDRFTILIEGSDGLYELEFPNASTAYCDGLTKALARLERIEYQVG